MIRTSTAVAKKPLCPLIMKGCPIIFSSVLFPPAGHRTLLAGMVSFEGALLGLLALRVIYLTFTRPGSLCSWESQNMETIPLFPRVAAVIRARFGANTKHAITPGHEAATRTVLCEEGVSTGSSFSFTQPQTWVTMCHPPH